MKKRKYSRSEAFALGKFRLSDSAWPEQDDAERMSETDWLDYIDKHGAWTVPVNITRRVDVAKLIKKGPGGS